MTKTTFGVHPLIARDHELSQLEQLWAKPTASLVVITGRRRIGKSTLAETFGSKKAKFIKIQGLAPGNGVGRQTQLDHFEEELRLVTRGRPLKITHWTEAFAALNDAIGTEKTVLLLDEISWMASDSPEFPGKLKNAWDDLFKKHPRLIVILCGSVSSWIDQNILKKTDFLGRVSLHIHLTPIPLDKISPFWRGKPVSPIEKIKFLLLSGGIPRYLEELIPQQPTSQNISRLCFQPGAFFLEEFDKIFNETFERRANRYKEILLLLVQKKLSFSEICKALRVEKNGSVSEYLEDLCLSGFIARDFIYNEKGTRSKISRYRISDNYVRFYLKYLYPHAEKIQGGLFEQVQLESLPNWNQIAGFQFENLVLANQKLIIRELKIAPQEITSCSPYFQKKTSRTKGACQIDLLITTRFGDLYLCEIKYKKTIGTEIISEIQQKMDVLKVPKRFSVRPVLIYAGELAEEVEQEHFFSNIISVEKWMS